MHKKWHIFWRFKERQDKVFILSYSYCRNLKKKEEERFSKSTFNNYSTENYLAYNEVNLQQVEVN